MMTNVTIVFDSGHEAALELPDALGTRLVASFAKFANGGEAPPHRFQVDDGGSFFVDFRKVSMILQGQAPIPAASPARRAKRG